jgi:hypothetical protein
MYNNWYQKKTKKTKRKPIVLAKGDLTKDAVAELQGEYDFLLKELSEGPKKEKLLEKLALKNRYNYLINDTGNINSTGYGGNFY